jgi:hypothetical protein
MKRFLLVASLVVLAGCGPRDKIGDRLLGIDSATNGRSTVTKTAPAPP